MPGPASVVRRLLQRLLGPAPGAGERAPELDGAVDGATAAAVLEVCVGDGAGLSPTFGGAPAAETYRREAARLSGNLLGERIAGVDAADARGALATAVGLSMSGLRASAFVTGPELASAQDLLALAAGRHLPLVVHLCCRCVAGPGSSLGGGHEAYHAAADAGAIQLFATSVQEVIDLALVARVAAELALVPAVVAMDDETARSVQDVRLPTAELVRALLGSAGDRIAPPDEGQRLLFGAQRRRVVRWHDLERPVLLGPVLDGELAGAAAAAGRAYFHDHVSAALSAAFDLVHSRTGRRLGPLATYEIDDARVVIVAQGAGADVAMAVAEHLRATRKLKVGVVAVRSLRPFPGGELAELLRGREDVIVLERTHSPLSGAGPLLREVRDAIRRPGRGETVPHDRPRLGSAIWGLGGQGLRGADLAAFIPEILERPRRLTYLGVDFLPGSSPLPKRQALLDSLRRAYPSVAELGFRASGPGPGTSPDAVSIAVCRLAGQGAEGVASGLSRVLHKVAGGRIRSRTDAGWEAFGAPRRDRVIHAASGLHEPGEDAPVDVALLAQPLTRHELPALRPGGAVLVESALSGEALWREVPAALRAAVRAGASLHVTAPAAGETPALRDERLLGALLGLLAKRPGLELKPRKLTGARTEALEDRPEAERTLHLAAMEAGLAGVVAVDASSFQDVAPAPRSESEAPLAVQRLGKRPETAECLDSLPRFHAQVGAVLERGQELGPDPYLATGAVPALSAVFRDAPAGRAMLPAFEPGACTGCGDCWAACPDGSVAPVAISAGALLEAGIGLAKERGAQAEPLRMLAGKLAQKVNASMKAAERAPERIRPVLDQAFGEVIAKAGLAEDRRKSIETAYAAVAGAVGELSAARAAPYFDEPEAQEKGKGELLALAIDPDTCKGCGLCVARCEPGALTAAADDPSRSEQARRAFRLWQALPDTPGVTIARLREHPDVGPLEALLLSRHALLAMAGGDGVEPGSGGKSALRLALAAGEFELQRRVAEHLKTVDEVRGQLADRIKKTLADALPVGDLDALAKGLAGGGAVDLAQVCAKAGAEKVDATKVARLAELGRQLADLRARLAEGAQGLGKARLGLVIAPGALVRGLATFPDNPFQAAAVVDTTGEGASLARGLLEGQLRQALADLSILRRARLELANPIEAALREPELARLSREELTDEERRTLPPVVLVGEAASFSERALAQLLDTDLPLKVLLLADADGGLCAHGLGGAEGSALEFLAPAHRGAYVAQSSLAHPWHLARGLSAAFRHDGPAVVRVHAPSPAVHGFAPERAIEQARLAVASRAFPLFTLDPAAPGVFGTRLSLEENPGRDAGWVDEGGGPLTPASWALTEARFAGHLAPLPGDAPGPTALPAYLALPRADRRGRTPFVAGPDGARHRPSPALVALCERRLGEWQTLQELSGVLTPFTAKVRAEAEASVADTHRKAVADLERHHAEKLAALEAEVRADAVKRVRDRLLGLAGTASGASKERF